MVVSSEDNLACPGCGTPGLYPFCEVSDVPVDVGRVEESSELARKVPRGDILLTYCKVCGLVHNIKFDPNRIGFEPGYEVALHHSEVFRSFITSVAERLIDRYALRDRRILDIGCGCGFFLETLCRLGPNQGIGIDPTVAQEGKLNVGNGSVNYVRDFWSSAHAHRIGDFVTCQSVFEDIKEPLHFLVELRSMLTGKNIPVYFEVFNGFRAFENGETWSIHYEQCNYFSLPCLERLFGLAGFQVAMSGHCYEGDQYLYVEALPGDKTDTLEEKTVPSAISDFSGLYAESVAGWTQRLHRHQHAGERIVLWGSGGKGVNFLNSVDANASKCIRYVVDINPDRQGRFIPGSGQQIVPPSFLVGYSPDVVILTNPIYRDEIVKQMKILGIDCEVQSA